MAGTEHHPQPVFWIDDDYDRAFATHRSRFAAYVRDRRVWFEELIGEYEDTADDLRSEFAAQAWRVTTGPVMSPGYVRSHECVLGSRLVRSSWDGQLVAEVELMAGWPAALTRSREWRTARLWSSWPEEFGRIYEPSTDQDDLDRRGYLTCTARAVFHVDSSRLPCPSLDDLEACAARTVSVLVSELDRTVWPIVTQLAGGR